MHTVGRWALRVPDGTDGPPNVPLWMDRLAVDLTDVAKDNQGTLGARPASTALSPGVSGRYFTTTDELDGGAARRRVYRDFGLGWDELATLPVSRRMLSGELALEHPAGLLTPAQFLALPAQPDGTVVRVQADAAKGVIWRLRLNGASGSASKWEHDGGSALSSEVTTAIASTASTAYVTLTLPSLVAPLAGDYVVSTYAGRVNLSVTTASAYGHLSYAIGAAAAADADALTIYAQANSGTQMSTLSMARPKTGIAAGATLQMRARVTAGTIFPNDGTSGVPVGIAVVPVRVTGPAVA